MLLTAARGGEKDGPQGPHKIQGMGAGLVPKVLDLELVDEVQAVHSDAAMAMANRMWLEEGLPVGVSAGAIVEAAVRVMSRPEMAGKLCVAIVPSFGERYFTQCGPRAGLEPPRDPTRPITTGAPHVHPAPDAVVPRHAAPCSTKPRSRRRP